MGLDNVSIHKSNKVKENLARYHQRIQLVFLPTRSPELNLIEVRWLWLHRQAINNSTFENESEIGKVVSEWTCITTKNIDSKQAQSVYRKNAPRCLHDC